MDIVAGTEITKMTAMTPTPLSNANANLNPNPPQFAETVHSHPVNAARTVTCLILVYTAYYFCRTDLAVALSVLTSGPTRAVFDNAVAGTVISYGYCAYAAGKLVHGLLLCRCSPLRVLHVSLLGSIFCTVLLSLRPLKSDHDAVVFAVLWACNRFFQSGGWPCIIVLVRSIFPSALHGRVLGYTSLSFSLGDAIIRLFLGHMLNLGISWQLLFFLSASCSTVLAIPSLFWVSLPLSPPSPSSTSSSPSLLRTRNIPSPPISSTALEQASRVAVVAQPRRVIRHSPRLAARFWVLLLQAPLFTWARELLLSWCALFLHDLFFQESPGDASIISVVLPLLGAVASVAGGVAADRLRPMRHTLYLVLVLLTAIATCLLALSVRDRNMTAVITALGAVSLFSTVPGSWSEGLFLFEVSQPSDAGWVVGTVHFAGYLGAVMAGKPIGSLVSSSGWVHVFAIACLVASANVVLALSYWLLEPPVSSATITADRNNIRNRAYSGANENEADDEAEEERKLPSFSDPPLMSN